MIKLCADVRSVNTFDHCPSCGGAVRLDADWCTQCFAALGQGFDPLNAPMQDLLNESDESVMARVVHVTPQPLASAVDPQPLVGQPQPARGRHARPSTSPLDQPAETSPTPDVNSQPTVDISDIDVMLGMLAAEHRSADPTSALAQHLGDKGAKTLFILGGVAVASMVFFILMFIAGLIL